MRVIFAVVFLLAGVLLIVLAYHWNLMMAPVLTLPLVVISKIIKVLV